MYLCLTLAQHRIRRAGASQRCIPASRCWSIFGDFGIAAGMIHTTSNFHRILPDPILNFFRPCRLEFLLTDGTWRIPQGRVVRSVDILLRRGFLRWTTIRPCCTVSGSFCVRKALVVANFPGFDPILALVRILKNIMGWMKY